MGLIEVTRLAYGKWDGSEHWSCACVELGTDEHGLWLGLPTGTVWSRPGHEAPWTFPAALLVPDDGYVARFLRRVPTEAEPDPVTVYVDVATTPCRHEDLVSAIDLDLDVVRHASGRVWLDDEDEFEEHAARWSYPDEVRARARATADRLLLELADRVEPFGQAADSWLARAAACTL